ncbi:MAG: hypothetical protein JXN64_15940 [Spirochaetes bacterium]|nr:hypothetical protein [Spirochaetota bacterium]
MIVSIDDLIKLTETCPNDFTFIPIEDIILKKMYKPALKLWEKGNRIPEQNFLNMQEDGIEKIDILFTNSLYKMLNVLNPDKYKDPCDYKTFIEVDKIISTFKKVNRVSKRKRYISFLCEIYNINDNGFNPVINFNEIIDDDKWNYIKTKIAKIKKHTKFPILYNEIGIIICVDLTKQNDSNFIERFKKNADICSLLVQKNHNNANFNISSEFNELTDIWTVNEPDKLLDTYVETNARLIVIGDSLNETYRSALLRVKNYDKFARFFVANNIDPNDSQDLLENIKNAYHKNNYTIE